MEYDRIFVSERMKLAAHMSALSVIIGTFLGQILDLKQKYAMVIMIWYKNLWMSMMLKLLLLEEMIRLWQDNNDTTKNRYKIR